ncbi:MAG: flavodoxin, partial [Lachnospiraceae bacterium]
HNFQNRTVAFIENGSWAPTAAKNMKLLLEPCKNLTFAQNEVHIKSALNEESLTQLEELATELCVEYHS